MPTVALLGVPYDASSSFQRGAAAAPGPIRTALWSPASSTWSEMGADLSAGGLALGGLAVGDECAIRYSDSQVQWPAA